MPVAKQVGSSGRQAAVRVIVLLSCSQLQGNPFRLCWVGGTRWWRCVLIILGFECSCKARAVPQPSSSDRCCKCQMVPQEVIDSGVGISVLPSFYSLLFLWLVGPFLGGRSCFERLPLGISNSSPMLACPVSPFTPLLLPSRCLGSQLSSWHEFLKKLWKIWKFWRPDSV